MEPLQHRLQRQRLDRFQQQRQAGLMHGTADGFAAVGAQHQGWSWAVGGGQAMVQDDTGVATVEVLIQ